MPPKKKVSKKSTPTKSAAASPSPAGGKKKKGSGSAKKKAAAAAGGGEAKPLQGKIKAMGYEKAKAKAKLIEYDVKPMAKRDVDFVVEACGVCHSDVHQIDNDWNMAPYPLVPGHEAAGRVVAVGDDVKHLAVGDRVALGAQNFSCLECEWCKKGKEQMCTGEGGVGFTYVHDTVDETGTHRAYGGFGAAIRTPAAFVFKVPDAVDLADAGVFLCGGVTVFAPLARHVRAGMRVAIAGVGGLGHIGCLFAKAMDGVHVTALSSSDSKKELALNELGVDEYIAMNDEAAVKAAADSFDFILITISASIDFTPYLGMAKRQGTVCFVGAPAGPVKFAVFPVLFKELIVTGSGIGGRKDIEETLAFAAKHSIKPITERFKHSEVNKAVQKVRDNTIRFRAVLENDL